MPKEAKQAIKGNKKEKSVFSPKKQNDTRLMIIVCLTLFEGSVIVCQVVITYNIGNANKHIIL